MSNITTFVEDMIASRLAKQIYVVLVKDDHGKLTLIVDPGLGKPWNTKRKLHAEQVAKECDGMAATIEEAHRLLLKENPFFERSLVDRVQRAAKIKANNLSVNKTTGQILDPHGRPVNENDLGKN